MPQSDQDFGSGVRTNHPQTIKHKSKSRVRGASHDTGCENINGSNGPAALRSGQGLLGLGRDDKAFEGRVNMADPAGLICTK